MENLTMEKNIEKFYKAFNFDLIQQRLDKFYKGKNTNAYNDIKVYFLKNNFIWRQCSGYVSKNTMSNIDCSVFCMKLFNQFPWLEKSAQQIDITNVGSSLSAFDYLPKNRLNQIIKLNKIKNFNTKNKNGIPKASSDINRPVKSDNNTNNLPINNMLQKNNVHRL